MFSFLKVGNMVKRLRADKEIDEGKVKKVFERYVEVEFCLKMGSSKLSENHNFQKDDGEDCMGEKYGKLIKG